MASHTALNLHIGGRQAKDGWLNLKIQAGLRVDVVGSCTDLSRFKAESFEQVYASHVIEHLGYQVEIPAAFAEIHRVFKPGGKFFVSVPDLETLCGLFVAPELKLEHRFRIMRMLFGGEIDEHDFHKTGLSWEFMQEFLKGAGFGPIERVEEFGLFEDASSLRFIGRPISLNVEARKAASD
jgi:predicted SAM-dependent methyltransferase